MKSVYLEYTSNTNQYYVTEEDYRNVIRPMVMKLRVCATCHQYYDPDNMRPCVGLRICLQCMLGKHPGLQFLEVKSASDDGEVTYAFIDQEGQVYTSRENHSAEPSQDISYSLKQQSFVLPEQYKPHKATEELVLHPRHFTVYGDLQTASVLVADYNDYSNKLQITFLLYKNGGYKELTKRREGKVLIERAVAMLERTKLPNGYFLIDGSQHSRIWDSDIYRVISQMESAMYNISMQFTIPVRQDQPDMQETEEAAPEVEEIKEPQVETDRPRRGKRPRLTIVPSQHSSSEDGALQTHQDEAAVEQTDLTLEKEELPKSEDAEATAVVEPGEETVSQEAEATTE